MSQVEIERKQRMRKRERDDRTVVIASYGGALAGFLALQVSWDGEGLTTKMWALVLVGWVAMAVATFYFLRAVRDLKNLRDHYSASVNTSWTSWFINLITALIVLQWSWHI